MKPRVAARVFGLGLGMLLLHAALPVGPTWANDAKEPAAQIDEQLFSRYKEAKKHERSDDRENAKAAYLEILDLLKPVDEKNLFKRLVILDYEEFKTRKGPLVIAGVESPPALKLEPPTKSVANPQLAQSGADADSSDREGNKSVHGFIDLSEAFLDRPDNGLTPGIKDHLRKVRTHLEKRDFSSAIEELNVAIKEAPDLGQLFLLRGNLRLSSTYFSHSEKDRDIDKQIEDQEACLGDLKRAVELGVPSQMAPIQLMEQMLFELKSKRSGGAEVSAKESVDGPKLGDMDVTPDQKTRQKKIHIPNTKREYEAIIAKAQERLKKNPNDAGAYIDMGYAYGNLLDSKKDIECCNKAIAIDPNIAVAYSERASGYLMQRQFDKALADLDKAISIDPNNSAFHATRGWIYCHQKRYREAIAACTKSISMYDGYSPAYISRARAHNALGNYWSAIADCTKAIELYPNEDSRYYSVRGYAFLQEGKYPEAISDFNTALKIEPDNLSALIYRGQALIDYGDNRAAVSTLNEAIRLDPEEPYSYTCRALAYMKLNNDSRALEDVNKALTLDPGNANASRLRGIYYLEKEGDYQKAIVDLGRSLKADPSSTTCNANMARAYMKLKLYDKAVEHWNNVIKLSPYDGSAYSGRGLAYGALGQFDKERADCNAAISRDPGNKQMYLKLHARAFQ